eukprot:c16780_g1_i1 orf=2-184(-)
MILEQEPATTIVFAMGRWGYCTEALKRSKRHNHDKHPKEHRQKRQEGARTQSLAIVSPRLY